MGMSFILQRSTSEVNFLGKKGQENNETRSSGIQIFVQFPICNTETLLFSTQHEKNSSETEHKVLYQFYWETLRFIAVGFT